MKHIFLLIFFLLSTTAAFAGMINTSADDAQQMLKTKRDSIYLLDVRTPQEYMEKRIDGATLIPISQFQARVKEVPRDKQVLVYCAVGSRSAKVADYLSQLGYQNVHNLIGGIWSWELRGYPILKGPGG